MQKRKFDELISLFNRKVSEMSIEQKYKMELLGMISAIGFAHEKELSTNLALLGTDCISRQAAIDALTEDEYREFWDCIDSSIAADIIRRLPPAEPKRGRWEQKDFKYHCSCCDGIAPKAIRWDFCPHCGAKMEVTE